MTEDYNRDIINSSVYQSKSEECAQLKEALKAAVEYNKELQEKIKELEAGRNTECVKLDETVTAMFYSEERDEWIHKKTTVRDILDSACDDYTVLTCSPGRTDGDTIYRQAAIDAADDMVEPQESEG